MHVQDRDKRFKKIGLYGRKTKIMQYLGKRKKKVLY